MQMSMERSTLCQELGGGQRNGSKHRRQVKLLADTSPKLPSHVLLSLQGPCSCNPTAPKPPTAGRPLPLAPGPESPTLTLHSSLLLFFLSFFVWFCFSCSFFYPGWQLVYGNLRMFRPSSISSQQHKHTSQSKIFHTSTSTPVLGHLWAFPPASEALVILAEASASPQLNLGGASTLWRNSRTIGQNWESEVEVRWRD